ncbi:MAG TPA: macrolide ABC transporter ATP-binding protein [Cytophagales bacterium]|nr:macrolide ABC transporter ATP-binding protein [Cytophagales bacterium]HAA19221.1 macrolide ABC transporter ATP-binding protein [Cytophagales bacterium]HAP62927.1 macrolide ABC transporter ATP-binding protein [Cytophagales bacterium]
MNVIESIGIHKTYTETAVPVHALRGVDLTVTEGEFTAIVGPSGSGKSTLLNIIGGLDQPSEGSIRVGGTDITHMKDSELIDFRLQNIGFVFQSYNLIPVLTAKENVAFIMLLQKKSKEEREERAMHLLKALGLEGRENNRPKELSGGQQQRVAVARALASKPKFILADEPTANLDSSSTANLLDIMAKMNQEEKITFVFSTHDQRVIDRAKRVVTLEDGVIKSDVSQEKISI